MTQSLTVNMLLPLTNKGLVSDNFILQSNLLSVHKLVANIDEATIMFLCYLWIL